MDRIDHTQAQSVGFFENLDLGARPKTKPPPERRRKNDLAF